MIDLTIVFAYLAMLLIIGIAQKPNISEFKGFATIGDKYEKNKLMMVATIFAASVGGGTSFGISEKAFAGNIAYSYGILFTIPVDLAIAKYVVPRLVRHHGAETVGDIMLVYYGKAGRYIGGIASILVSIGLIAAQISVSGRIFEQLLDLPYIWGIIISYTVIAIYTTIGGLKSVLFTNQLQFFAIIIAIPTISIIGIYDIGVTNFIQHLPLEKVSIIHSDDLLMLTIVVTLGFASVNLFPTFIQRALINKNSAITTKAIYIKSLIYAIFLVFTTLNGLISFIKYPDIQAHLALPYLIDHMIPIGIKGFVVVGLLAAVMSTADSDLNITSITLVKDLLVPMLNLKKQKKMLLIARIFNILIGAIAIIIALSFNRITDLVIFIAGFWSSVILVPLLFGLFDKVITPRLMVISSIISITSFIMWEQWFRSPNGLKGVFVGLMINLCLFLVFYYKARICMSRR